MIPSASFHRASGSVGRSFGRIGKGVSFRPLFALLIAMAMLFAPFAVGSGPAMAMAPADHQAQMADKGHCGGQPANGKDSKATIKSCCAAMCTAVAVAPAPPAKPQGFARALDRPSVEQFYISHLAELATPPPRRA